jgi:hypothetical protein
LANLGFPQVYFIVFVAVHSNLFDRFALGLAFLSS